MVTIQELDQFPNRLPAGAAIRRWYVSRICPREGVPAVNPSQVQSDEARRRQIDESLVADLISAELSEQMAGDPRFSWHRNGIEEIVRAFRAEECEPDNWWKDENFDLRLHLTVSDLRHLLAHPDGAIEEGMVFVEINDGTDFMFVPFTYQARRLSKRVSAEALDLPKDAECGELS